MSVAVMVCYARSGGTLLNKCLGCLPGVVMLSEVNPQREACRNPLGTVRRQAEAWYGIRLRSEGFVENVRELARECGQRGWHLIVRDWTVADFVACRGIATPPGGRLSVLESIGETLDCKVFAFVRDAVDVWLSNGGGHAFFGAYRRYVERVCESGIPVFRYEDFCEAPREQLQRLCGYIHVPYDDGFEDRYRDYDRVTGDVSIPGGSRGARAGGIRLLPRRRISRGERRWVNSCEDMVTANRLLGYLPCYEGRACPSWSELARGRLRRRVGNVGGGSQRKAGGA